MSDLIKVGTQTAETSFRQEQLHSMMKYLMNTIRNEDFLSDED